jgi:hypothetical protein
MLILGAVEAGDALLSKTLALVSLGAEDECSTYCYLL